MKTVTIEEACHLVTDGTHGSFRDAGQGVPFLTVKDMSGQGLDFIGCTHITQEEYAKADAGNSAPKVGDVLFSKDGTVGKVHVVTDSRDFAVLSSIAILRPKLGILNSQYFGWILRCPNTIRQAEQRKTGSALRRIILKDLKKVKIPLPPIAEQKRIAAILDKAEELRSFRRQALGELDALTQSIFLEMFGNVGSTSSFRTQPLESLLKQPLQNGAYFQKEAYVEEGGIEMVHMSDAFYEVVVPGNLKQVICSADELAKYRLSENDLLIARRSLNYEGAAKPCLIPNSPTPLIFESSFIRVTPNPQKIDVLFLFHYLSNEWVRRKCIRPFVTQSTISGINQSNLARVPVLTPPLPLQQEFARRVEAIEQLKATHRKSLAHLDALFISLQHRAFRGEL